MGLSSLLSPRRSRRLMRSFRPIVPSLLTSCLLSIFSAAQTAQPRLQVNPQLDNAPLAPAYTIQAGTQLVLVDVVVKDRKGKQIHGLKAPDFSLSEGGKLQQIRNFEEHSALTATQAAATAAVPQLPPGEFTNFVTTPQTGALNIILYDTCNTAVKDQMYMRAQLVEYLKHARPDSRTAIFALNTSIVQIAGFTSNPADLLAALTRKKSPQSSLFVDDTSGGLTASQNSTIAGAAIASAAGGFSTGIAAMEGPLTEYQADQRAYVTLDGLNSLGRFLVTLPGRKNLIWFAGDFPENFFPSENNYDGSYAQTGHLENEFRQTVNLLTKAQVAVYPIDAQALRTDQDNSASRANASYASGSGGMGRKGSPEASGHQAEFGNTSREQSAMKQIAHDTGGEAYFNRNDLSRMVTDAVNDGATYYTLAYSPSDARAKDGFRGINVKVAGDGPYQLSYRRGYFIDKKSTATTASAPGLQPAASSLTQALRPGAPQPSQILLRLKAYPATAGDQLDVVAGNEPNPDKKLAHGPFRVYEIDAAVGLNGFSFSHGPDNILHTTADFVTYVYDVKGNLINAQSNTAKLSYTREKLDQTLKTGLHFSERISVPSRGEYFLRVAVRDNTSNHVGSLELPVAAIAGIRPPAAPVTSTGGQP